MSSIKQYILIIEEVQISHEKWEHNLVYTVAYFHCEATAKLETSKKHHKDNICNHNYYNMMKEQNILVKGVMFFFISP